MVSVSLNTRLDFFGENGRVSFGVFLILKLLFPGMQVNITEDGITREGDACEETWRGNCTMRQREKGHAWNGFQMCMVCN